MSTRQNLLAYLYIFNGGAQIFAKPQMFVHLKLLFIIVKSYVSYFYYFLIGC